MKDVRKRITKVNDLILKVGVIMLVSTPSYAHASLTDWIASWKEFFHELWPLLNIVGIVLGTGFAIVGIVGALSAKKQERPAAAWQLWFVIGGIVLTIVGIFIAATGDTVSGRSGAFESNLDEWGFQ